MYELPVSPPSLEERAILMYLTDPEYNPESYEEYRAKVLQKCEEDTAWFINFALYTFDPRADVEVHDIPFILYDFQIDAIRFMDDRLAAKEDGLMEKSRDMGVTWLTLSWGIHKWRFRPGFQMLVGSRKEDLVDNWTRDSHFGKMEYLVDKMPYWMLPRGYSHAQHRMKLKLMNPELGNVIIGESANSDFSRQGRYTAILFDEAAFWPDLTSSLRAAAQATRTRFLVSTPNGQNTFARERESGRWKVKTLHWRLHPNKDEAWYKFESARMSPEDVAQELDISYHRSARGVVYPQAHNIPRGRFHYKHNWPLYTSWDFGIADDTAIIWWQRDPKSGKLFIIDAYKNNGKSIDFYAPFVLGMIPDGNTHDYTMDDLVKIHQHSQYNRSINFGDPDVAKTALASGTSALSVLSDLGIIIFTNAKSNSFRDRKAMTDQGLRQIEGLNTEGSVECNDLFESLTNARFPTRNPDSRSTSEVIKPIHDWTEAYRSATEYFFVNMPPHYDHDYNRPKPIRRQNAYDKVFA